MAKEETSRSSNIFSKLLFLKSFTLLKINRQKEVEANDVRKLFPYSKSKKLGDSFEEKWTERTKKKKVSIVGIIWSCFGTTFFSYGIIQAFIEISIAVLAQPYLVGKIVSYFTPKQTTLTKTDALFYTFTLIFLLLVNVLYESNFGLRMAAFGIKIRTALCSFLFRKILKLSSTSLNTSGGKFLTFITKDVQAVEMFAVIGNLLWICSLKVLITCYILYTRIGVSSFAGIGCFILVLPLQIYHGEKVKTFKIKMCQQTDKRLQIIQETMSEIRLIKMYTWEKFFAEKIQALRKQEMNKVLKMFVVRFCSLGLGLLTSEIAMYLTLIIYIKSGNNISAETIYNLIFIFRYLTLLFASDFPNVVYRTSEALAATRRFDTFLQKMEELENGEKNTKIVNITVKNVSVTIQEQQILKNVTVDFQSGLTIISGPVGSGKSTFLKTLLKEYTSEGNLTVEGSISYTSQEPWLFPATIKDNILFGQEFNTKRYQEVLRVCALSYDLELMDDGDLTIVEDRGANLSKGQQTRVNLARAVYKNSDIYLLDDPLAGLDSNVAALVFEECLKKFLENKIVVLVTHNVNLIKNADNVVFFKNGTLSTFNESELQIEESLDEKKTPQNDKNEEDETDESSILLDKTNKKAFEEKKQTGTVQIRTYRNFAKLQGGVLVSVLGLLSQGSMVGLMNFKDVFISNWVNEEETLISLNKTTDLTKKHNNVFNTYSILLGILVFTVVIRAFTVVIFSRRVSIKIHTKMINCLFGSVVEFFDNNFLGNILNRFSKDLTVVDEVIPFSVNFMIRGVTLVVTTTTVIAFVDVLFLVPLGTLFFSMILFRRYTIKTSNNLKRLDTITRSPVVGHFNSTLEGLTTIRAFNAEETVKKTFDYYQDVYSSTSYAFQSSSKAFVFVLNALSALFNICVIMKFFIVDDEVEAGYVGLSIFYTFYVCSGLNMAISTWVELENQMTSVERAVEYTEIRQESSQKMEIENWPQNGEISFENVYLSYPGSKKCVLNNFNLVVKPREKIGIVGRTGAGKSSLISSLFRLYNIEGIIRIDGVDVKSVSLNFLRSHISIIPQEPIVFSGTIRENLDPFKKFSDEEIWTALGKVNLKKHVTSLDLEIGTKNLNFSVGEKQLLCITRAILQKNKIVVLDEATASIDEEREKIIHKLIEENFSGCTVLTIAHKLRTVLKCDQVVVLEKGVVLEHGRPKDLLENQNSKFYKMSVKAGLLSINSDLQT